MVLMLIWLRFFHTQSRGFTGFQDTRVNLDLNSSVLQRVSPFLFFLQVLQGMGWSHWCFQFLSSIRNDFFEFCEEGGDVVGVLTLLVGGVAQAFHDDRVVELRIQLRVQEVEEKRDREEQVEVERERRVKEMRPWMTTEMVVK